MKPKIQILLITSACVAAYFAMRLMPLKQCSFLHYGDYINKDGVIEGCGYEETDFFVMSDLRYPIVTTLTPLEEPEQGKPLTCKLTLFTTTGNAIKWEEIAVSHTERIHAMIVDPSLEDYQHVHPQPTGIPGHFLVSWKPKRAGTYKIYLDLIPLINSRRTLLETEINVPGNPVSPIAANKLDYATGNYRFAFTPEQKHIKAGVDHVFTLEVSTTDNSPVTFSTVMNAYAHVVAFDQFHRGFAHLHPLNPLTKEQDPTKPDLRFALRFDRPGYFRVWAQMILDGNEVFVPFDIIIEPDPEQKS